MIKLENLLSLLRLVLLMWLMLWWDGILVNGIQLLGIVQMLGGEMIVGSIIRI
ncbi:hypothetical protein H4Q26_015129, partial [Puccinia striiformis f. sp. tritici PST-130]